VNRRPLLASAAALTAVALTAAAGSAGAATAAVPAAGNASSTVELLDLLVGGHSIQAGTLELLSNTVDGKVAKVTVTPITADGTDYGTQTVTPATSPKGVASASSPGALSAFAGLTSPAVDVSASDAPSTHAGTTSLGGLTLLGLPVSLDGGLSVGSSVSNSGGAVGTKTLSLENVALPSIADVLASLGLDLTALPVDTLTSLLDQLDLVTGAVTTAQNAVDAAQAQLDAAVSDVATQTAALSTAQSALTTAQSTLAAATTALTDLLGVAGFVGAIADYAALAQPLKDALELLAPGLAAAYTDYVAAGAAVTAATTAVATVQGLLDTAQALVTTLTATLAGLVDTLVSAVTGVLDGTPLVSLESLTVKTLARATSASAGGQTAQVVGGTITGLEVLGTDVLDLALGDTTLDLGSLVGDVADHVNTTIADVTGSLSEVLSSVPGLPALDVPAPVVTLLQKSTSTSVSGGFGRALTSVSGLSISIPAITVPLAAALPDAADLPALNGVTQAAGVLESAPIRVGLLTLRDQAAYRPAIAATGGSTPGTDSGTPGTGEDLADTGLPIGVTLLSLGAVAGAVMLRRRATLMDE